MTLTEFLLARIAEDEEVAKEMLLSAANQVEDIAYDLASHFEHWRRQSQYTSPLMLTGAQSPVTLYVPPARVLAECEAKRRIVALSVEFSTDEGLSSRIVGGSIRVVLDETLRALAQPYADHPDYQQEWVL